MVKTLLANTGDTGSNSEWGRSPGEGNGNPLQYSCLENPMNRATWQATIQRVTKSQTQQINNNWELDWYSEATMHFRVFSIQHKS